MGEALKTVKTHAANKETIAAKIQKSDFSQSYCSAIDQVLFLQRTIGNQAVGGLLKSGALQAKLKIGQPGDKYEQEADRVADEVMRIPEPQAVSKDDPHIQRVCEGCEEEELRCQPIEEEGEEELLQTKEISGQNAETTPDLESRINAIRGGGQPLTESERAFFEPRFGNDFSKVRVHTGVNATKIAESIYARAFTRGNNIVFGHGQYSASKDKGRRLLGHELTHVIQQDKSGFVSGNSHGPICEVSKMRTESIQRDIEPYTGISGDFIIRVNPGINDESAFIRQVSEDLATKVMREHVSNLMLIDRFRDLLEVCWNQVLSLRRPGSRQIVVRLVGWGGRVSSFILISPRVVMPSPEEIMEPGEGTLPPLQPPSTETEPSEQAPRACTRRSSEPERRTVEQLFRNLHADNPLAIRLLRNFMDCRGTRITLTVNEMREILPYFNIQTNYTGYTRNDKVENRNFWRRWAQLMSSTDNSIPANLTSQGFANLRGTLGIFTIHWEGHLYRRGSVGGWEFLGEIWFTDYWDLNSARHRGIFELGVQLGRSTINGAGFHIDSVRVNANEIGANYWIRDNEPVW